MVQEHIFSKIRKEQEKSYDGGLSIKTSMLLGLATVAGVFYGVISLPYVVPTAFSYIGIYLLTKTYSAITNDYFKSTNKWLNRNILSLINGVLLSSAYVFGMVSFPWLALAGMPIALNAVVLFGLTTLISMCIGRVPLYASKDDDKMTRSATNNWDTVYYASRLIELPLFYLYAFLAFPAFLISFLLEELYIYGAFLQADSQGVLPSVLTFLLHQDSIRGGQIAIALALLGIISLPSTVPVVMGLYLLGSICGGLAASIVKMVDNRIYRSNASLSSVAVDKKTPLCYAYCVAVNGGENLSLEKNIPRVLNGMSPR